MEISIVCPVDTKDTEVMKIAAKKAGLKAEQVRTFRILKRAYDARRKNDIKKVYNVLISNTVIEDPDPTVPFVGETAERPIVIGYGPAGIFCAYILAKAGMKPIVLERGKSLDGRQVSVQKLWRDGVLDENANAQFGEGGAGAFSDGKLNTGIKDKALCDYVLKCFVRCGASPELRYDNKPHIGTDKLCGVVTALRHETEALGGEIVFNAKVSDITRLATGKWQVTAGRAYIASTVVLAIGHSARDTYRMLYERGFAMQQKPFAVGVRAEHLQKDINAAMYGANPPAGLPVADYHLAEHTPLGGVYSFCMCPGGYVICGASEQGGIAVNGMSYNARDGVNANAALLVGVDGADFGSAEVLAGVEYQRRLERAAFETGGGGYKAPCQRFGDFVKGQKTTVFGKVAPSYAPGVVQADLNTLLPERIAGALKLGIEAFGKRIAGYNSADTLLTAPETRSSAPIRILRGDDYQSIGSGGVYPCGEGCGYAGGIMSAAVDGIKVAMSIISAVQK